MDIRNVVIRRVNILDPGWHGIHLDRSGLGGFVNGEIENCSVRLPFGDGIHIDQGSALAIRHNRNRGCDESREFTSRASPAAALTPA